MSTEARPVPCAVGGVRVEPDFAPCPVADFTVGQRVHDDPSLGSMPQLLGAYWLDSPGLRHHGCQCLQPNQDQSNGSRVAVRLWFRASIVAIASILILATIAVDAIP